MIEFMKISDHPRGTAWYTITDSRPEDYTSAWLEKVNCPVIHVDGTLPAEENTAYLLSVLGKEGN